MPSARASRTWSASSTSSAPGTLVRTESVLDTVGGTLRKVASITQGEVRPETLSTLRQAVFLDRYMQAIGIRGETPCSARASSSSKNPSPFRTRVPFPARASSSCSRPRSAASNRPRSRSFTPSATTSPSRASSTPTSSANSSTTTRASPTAASSFSSKATCRSPHSAKRR